MPLHWIQNSRRVFATLLLAAGFPAIHAAAAAPDHSSGCPAAAQTEQTLAEASSLLQQARYADAVTLLRPAAAGLCDPRLSLLLAGAQEGAGDVDAAIATLSAAHADWPDSTSLDTSLAREYLRTGQPRQAAAALAGFHATAATPQPEMQLAVVVYLATHQLQAAHQLAQLAYATYPSVRSLLLMANTLQMEGRYKDVIALLNAQRATYPGSAPFLVTVAESEYDGKLFDQARADLERAVALQPGLYQAHYVLGNVLMSQGAYAQAVPEYRAAIALDANQPHAWYQLGLALRAQQDSAGEEAALQKALALDPQFAEAHAEMGRLLLDRGATADAVAQLRLAVAGNPSSEQAWTLLARGYARLGQLDQAKQAAAQLAAVRAANHKSAAGAMQ